MHRFSQQTVSSYQLSFTGVALLDLFSSVMCDEVIVTVCHSRLTVVQICLIMDEVDGMSGGDRGGVSELITIIKASKVPVICICNDKYSQKLKSLRNSCMELDFRRVS